MKNARTGIRFTLEQSVQNLLDSFLTAKLAEFCWNGVYKSPERWKMEIVIAQDARQIE